MQNETKPTIDRRDITIRIQKNNDEITLVANLLTNWERHEYADASRHG